MSKAEDTIELTIYVREDEDQHSFRISAYGRLDLSSQGYERGRLEPRPGDLYEVRVRIPRPVPRQPERVRAESVKEIRVIPQEDASTKLAQRDERDDASA